MISDAEAEAQLDAVAKEAGQLRERLESMKAQAALLDLQEGQLAETAALLARFRDELDAIEAAQRSDPQAAGDRGSGPAGHGDDAAGVGASLGSGGPGPPSPRRVTGSTRFHYANAYGSVCSHQFLKFVVVALQVAHEVLHLHRGLVRKLEDLVAPFGIDQGVRGEAHGRRTPEQPTLAAAFLSGLAL